MMLHEVYNITDQGMQRVLDSLAHPSMEYAVQQESLLRDSLSCEYPCKCRCSTDDQHNGGCCCDTFLQS